MAHIFVDDGYPDADEYESSYVWYDPQDPESLRTAIAKAHEIFDRRRSHRTVSAANRRSS